MRYKKLYEAFDFNKIKVETKSNRVLRDIKNSYINNLIDKLNNNIVNKQALCYNDNAYYITNNPLDNNIIAICVGEGLWAPINWSGLIKEYIWASSLINNIIFNSRKDGLYNTKQLLELYRKSDNTSLWKNITEFESEGIPQGYVYLPAHEQLEEIYNNINMDNVNAYLYRFLDEDMLKNDITYWGSSMIAEGHYACALSLQSLLKKQVPKYGIISYESIDPNDKYKYNSMVLLNIDKLIKYIKNKMNNS